MSTLCVAALVFFFSASRASEIKGDAYKYLPATVVPIRYRLSLEAHPDVGSSFSGSVAIDVKILADIDNITLHSKDLEIDREWVRVTDNVGNDVPVVGLGFENDFCVIGLGQKLVANERYRIEFGKFVGSLEHDQYGFFVAKYRDAKGDEHSVAVTFFQPHGARMAFPCFDEPALKAKFVLSLVRSKSYHTTANAELERSTFLESGLVRDTYKETPPMSTYIVAFAVVDYSYTEKSERVRVMARRDAIRLGIADYVRNQTVRLLKTMEDYTGIDYAMEKLDLLGVPSPYFMDGAMENWGLIVYNEKHLLYSKATSTTEDLQRCFTYTAHELSHQWFGNLATPSKWNYIWLSEGFAAYFQYYLADMVEPTWQLKEQYVFDYLLKSLSGDLLPMAEPMNYVFSNLEHFPSPWIYYYKASAVIRMMEMFLTPAVFRRGLKIYLEKKKFGSSVPEDLYSSVQKAVNQAGAQYLLGPLTVSQVWSTWDSNVGYPLVTVTRNYTDGTITVAQERYSVDADAADRTVWTIPINYATNRRLDFFDTTPSFWLTQRSLTFDNFKSVNWILLNKQYAGYFRVNYDEVNWNRLAKFLRTSKFWSIHALNRAQLINDAFQLVEDGKLSAKIAMDLSVYIRQETEFLVLKVFAKRVESLDFMMSATEQYVAFKTYVKHLLSLAFGRIGVNERPHDSHVNKLLRVVLARIMCPYGDSSCQNYGLRALRDWRRSGTLAVRPDVEFEVLCGAMQIADERDRDFLYRKYGETVDVHARRRYLNALGCSHDESLQVEYLDRMYDFDNGIALSDRVQALTAVVELKIVRKEFLIAYLSGRTIAKNDSFKEEIAAVTTTQAISRRFKKELEALKASGNEQYIPAKYFTGKYFEPYEVDYISQVSDWLLQNSNFV